MNNKWIYGSSPQLLTYYDISSAEVKSAGYLSGDPNLIHLFETAQDVYIRTAMTFPGKPWDQLSKEEQKKRRKQAKTVFLGLLYGLGIKSLAERLMCTEDEARAIIESTYQAFPKLREYIDRQSHWPETHSGYINTMLGDKLKISEYDLLLRAKSQGEARNLQSRMARLGVNLPIQGGTASLMASGFFNTIRQSLKEGWKYPLEGAVCVHDSSTSSADVSKIFEIRKFYDTYFTEYCAGIGPKIRLLFDLLVGNGYESACVVEHKNDNQIVEFKGNAHTLLPIYDKIMSCPDYKVSANLKREELIPDYVLNPIQRFIKSEGTCVFMDKSEYILRFEKIG